MRRLAAAAVLAAIAWTQARALGEDTLPLGGETSQTIGLVLVRSGEFKMGSPETEIGRKRHEGPQTRVKITRDYWLGRTEVTQRQFEAVMFRNPSVTDLGPDLPVNNVSRHEAEEFCARLSSSTGRTVRLPTEAEWEFACRAGTETRYFCGDDEESLDAFAWFDGNSGGRLHPVGMKKSNPMGLHDMTGNAFEWCSNPYGPYPGGTSTDWRGPDSSPFGVLRPGVFYLDEFMCRSAARSFWPPDARDRYFGFRVLVEAGSGEAGAPAGDGSAGGASSTVSGGLSPQSARVLGK